MKTLIVGTGIIGTIYGWALAEAGVDVTHFVRQGKAAQFKDGIRLDLLDERKGHAKYNKTTYAIRCVEEVSPADGYDLVIVPTNSYQVESVLQALVPCVGPETTFLLFAANWDGVEMIERYLPRHRYLMGYADGGGTKRDGVYWTNLGAEVHLGEVDGKPSEKLERVKALFAGADMTPDVQENILHWLWLHNAMSVGIWAAFAKHKSLPSFLKDRPLLVQGIRSTRELIALCGRRGVDLSKYPDAGSFKMPMWFLVLFLRRLYSTNESMQRYTAHAADSLDEARALCSAVLKTADELGFPMPETKALSAYLR